MFRRTAILLLVALLSGCCSISADDDDGNCEALERSRKAAQRGWKNAQGDLSPDLHPTLHEGMTARAVKSQLGPPPRKERGQSQERWIYEEDTLTVIFENDKVTKWKQK